MITSHEREQKNKNQIGSADESVLFLTQRKCANNDAVIDLLHTHKAIELPKGKYVLPGEVAFPMTVRGRVNGLVLMGAKSSGNHYRPDQIALLSSGVHQLGQDLESLRVVELERLTAVSRHNAESLEQRLSS